MDGNNILCESIMIYVNIGMKHFKLEDYQCNCHR